MWYLSPQKNKYENVENYRPASILNCISKVFGKSLLRQFKPFINTFFAVLMYRENKLMSDVVLVFLLLNLNLFHTFC